MNQRINDLMAYLDGSHSVFHAVEGLRNILENAGYKTVRVYDGKKALEVAQGGGIDLCIIDIMMPELNGWELTREIRKFSNIPIIMLSVRGAI